MKQVYLNSFQLHDNETNIGFWLEPNIKGLEMPTIRLPNFERPNIDGAFVPNQLYGERAISFVGKVGASSLSEYRTRRRELENACRIYRPGDVLTPITLKFTTMDDLNLQCEVYTRKLSFPDINMIGGGFNLDLIAPDVRLLSQTQKDSSINIFSGGGMEIPMGIPMDMSNGGTIESSLENSGDIDAFPTIIFYGTIEDPTLTNSTTGKSFSLDYDLTSTDERIEINVKNRTVLYFSGPSATGVNIRQYFTGDWMTLAPGNNTMKLIVVNSADVGYALLRWRDSYLGV